MNRKSMIIAVVTCICCSLVSFVVGYSVLHGTESSKTEQEKVNDEDSKYAGLYVSTTYSNGSQQVGKLYLYPNHSCDGPDTKHRWHFQSCEWSVKENRVILYGHGSGGGQYAKSLDECRELEENGEGKMFVFDENDERPENYPCIVISESKTTYDILDDGSLSNSDGIYQKRGTLQ